jgi:glyoxylase-like metal-dependent hydrolase (beta-lactamase superfamily II)
LNVIRTERHGDVIQLELSHARSRAIGFSVNVYVVRGALIDSGFPAAGGQVEQIVRSYGARGAFITHSHEDHAGNVERLARMGLPVAAGAVTLETLRTVPRLRLYRRWTWGTPAPLRSPVIPFTDADLVLLATPGHADDHHVVWDASEGTLFSSDLYLGTRVAVGHPNERPRRLVRSLREMLALGPSRMFDAHRGAIRDPIRALTTKAEWLEETIGRIEALIDRGLDDQAIRRAVLGREGAAAWFSGGEYSKRNFVAATRREGCG